MPSPDTQTPAIPVNQSRKTKLRPGSGEVVAFEQGELQKISGDLNTYGMKAVIIRSGATETISIKSGHRILTTPLQIFAQHVRQHAASLPQPSRRSRAWNPRNEFGPEDLRLTGHGFCAGAQAPRRVEMNFSLGRLLSDPPDYHQGMKIKNAGKTGPKLVNRIGQTLLIKSNGRHKLIGGSANAPTQAKEWASLFARGIVLKGPGNIREFSWL